MADSTVRVAFVGDTRDFKRAVAQVEGSSRRMESGFGRLTKSFGTFTKLAAGGFAVKKIADGFIDVTKAAADENQEIAKLNRLLKNAKVPDAVIKSTDAWVTSLQNASAVADTDLRLALGTLVSSGNDVAESQDILKTAMDVSTARGLKLQTVVVALAKASRGNTTALSRYGIATKDASGKTKSFDQILKDLNTTFGGSTAAAADTAAGKFEIMKLKIDDVKERIGNALLPILQGFVDWASAKLVPFIETKLVPAFEAFAAWLRENLPKVKEVLEKVFGGADKLITDLADAFGTSKGTIVAAIGAISAALIGLAVAWNAGPGVIITGIAALVAAFLYFYNENEKFRNYVRALMAFVVLVFGTAISIMINLLSSAQSALQAFGDVWSNVWGTVVRVWNETYEQLKPIFELVERFLNLARDLDDSVPGGLVIPNPVPGGPPIPIPGLASGGIVTGPTLALIGEAGPEAVIPLNRLGTGSGLTVNIYGDVNSEIDFERKVTAAVANASRRGVLVG